MIDTISVIVLEKGSINFLSFLVIFKKIKINNEVVILWFQGYRLFMLHFNVGTA